MCPQNPTFTNPLTGHLFSMDLAYTVPLEILDSRNPGIPILGLLITSCVTLGQLSNLSEFCFCR